MRKLILSAAWLALLLAPLATARAAAPRFFPETGQTVRDPLLAFWDANGGLPVFGLPVSDQRSEQTFEARVNLQHFERNRLELHPENAAPYNVLLGRLGDDLLRRQGRDWRSAPSAANPLGGSCQRFAATEREVCGPFLQYWQSHGLSDSRLDSYGRSLALFGLPLTGVKAETNSSGDTVLTQWFERARFEWHPANPEPYKVLLGRLGAEVYDPAHPNGGATTYVPVRLPDGHTLEVPQGFTITQLTAGLQRPRMLANDGRGGVLVAEMGVGRVLWYPQLNGQPINWAAPRELAAGLMNPHSIAVSNGQVFIAAEDQIVRGSLDAYRDGQPWPTTKITELPLGSRDLYGHRTRTLLLSPDETKLYVSIGSSCDVCEETDPRRATVMRFNFDGTGGEIWSSGLRNTVGLDFYPGTSELWGVDNGRNLLGDGIPPEELNHLTRGTNFGWPYCYGDRVPNPEFNDAARCAPTAPPAWTMAAHTAPLGMTFYTGRSFPPAYQNDALVAIHGSTELPRPAGYNVVRVKFKDGQPVAQEDVMRGWLVDGAFWGRPVGLLVLPDGDVLISDDAGGRIYRLHYSGL